MALFYGFSWPFSLSFRLLYFAWPKHVFNFDFPEVSNIFQIADFRADFSDDGRRIGLPER